MFKLKISILFFVVSFLPGCNSSSGPEIFHSPIDLVEQVSVAKSESHSYLLNDFRHIVIRYLKTLYLQDNFGQKYAINYTKVEPIENGTIEMEFQFFLPQKNEPDRKEKTIVNDFAGIGFKTDQDDNFFSALLYKGGKLTFGKLGKKPLVTEQLSIKKLTYGYHKVKISFLDGHLMIFLDGIPVIRYKGFSIQRIKELAIIIKYNEQPENRKLINVVNNSFKYSKLKKVSYRDSVNIFKYLEEENVLRGDYHEENNGGMNIFEITPEIAKNKNPKLIFIGDVTIKSETRRSIYAPAPTKIVYPLSVTPDSYLNFAYAIAHVGWEKSDGVLFSITFKPDGGKKKNIFSKFLDPQKAQNRKWFEERVDLSGIAGLSGELILETLPEDGKQAASREGSELFDFGLWGDPAIYHKRGPDQLNVILISLDTLRADHLGAYGYFRNTSPYIDMLAKNGTLFKNTVTQSPWTLPSHMSMFTSLYPSQLGYSLMNRIQKKVKIPEKATTLAEILKENGYLTAAFTGGANVSKVFGFNDGFSFYNELWGTEIDTAFKNMSDWMQSHRKDNFFLFFHTFEIHKYPPGEHEIFTNGINPQDKVNYTKALYDGKIKYVDDYIGLLIDKLKSLNIFDKTLIVITSDHGEEFYEHGVKGHGEQFYDEVLMVPLIFHLKNIVSKNTVINDQVRSIDIMPSILDILNISIPKAIEGTSLVPFYKKNVKSQLMAFTEASDYLGKINNIDQRSLRTSQYKYILYPKIEKDLIKYLKSNEKETGFSVDQYNRGEGELYNLLEDPEEQSNIINLESSVAADFRNKIKIFIKENREKNIAKEEEDTKNVTIDKVTLERLKSLGYLQ